MWLWTRQEAKRIDELTIQSGVPAETLMETAGQRSAKEISQFFPLAQTAVVLCGPGNNGGDGYVVARELGLCGYQVTVVESVVENKSDLRAQKRSDFQGRKLPIEEFLKNPSAADLWVDGLFGIGLSRPLAGADRLLIQHVNQSTGFKVALDTPSGLDVDTGNILGACFEAHWTLTVGRSKPGLYLNHGPKHCGKIKSLDIGFPPEISKREAHSVFLLTSRIAKKWLPQRDPTDNKTKGGRALIWAGSSEMPGAAILACRAAGRVGAGYVFCSEREVLRASPEVIPWTYGSFSKLQSALIGPGLGTGEPTADAIEELKKSGLPVVVDADALTVAAREKLFPFPKNWIATPHAGELSRFLKASSQEIEGDRISFARKSQELLGCTVLLKGFHTVVALKDFSVIVPAGNVALAKGGSGDVLGGMIAGFLSQGLASEKAALLAAHLHGKMADDWVQSGKDHLSLTPSDLLDLLPESLHNLRSFAGHVLPSNLLKL